MLEGKNVDLKIAEKEDLPFLLDWWNNPEFAGRYNPLDAQQSKADIEKQYEKLGEEKSWFLILKKDGTRIGFLGMGIFGIWWEIGFVVIPEERGKGYCTEAAQIAVDYLFLSKNVVRVQAATMTENLASQRVLEKAGFRKEGTVRKGLFAWGNWVDINLYGLLREDWKQPRVLTKLE